MREKIDIVLPVYREEGNIAEVLMQIKEQVKTPHRMIVVWQDRRDPTMRILTLLKRTMKNLELVECKDGVGVVKALRAGYRHARAPIVVTMMADLSDDASDIDKMVALMNKGYDVVAASRYHRRGKRVGGPRMKGFLSHFACWTLSHIFHFPTTDATNAFRVFRRSFLQSETIESLGGFELPLELTVKAFRKGLRIGEVPTIWHERSSGKSKFKLVEWFPQYLRWYSMAVTHSMFLFLFIDAKRRSLAIKRSTRV